MLVARTYDEAHLVPREDLLGLGLGLGLVSGLGLGLGLGSGLGSGLGPGPGLGCGRGSPCVPCSCRRGASRRSSAESCGSRSRPCRLPGEGEGEGEG